MANREPRPENYMRNIFTCSFLNKDIIRFLVSVLILFIMFGIPVILICWRLDKLPCCPYNTNSTVPKPTSKPKYPGPVSSPGTIGDPLSPVVISRPGFKSVPQKRQFNQKTGGVVECDQSIFPDAFPQITKATYRSAFGEFCNVADVAVSLHKHCSGHKRCVLPTPEEVNVFNGPNMNTILVGSDLNDPCPNSLMLKEVVYEYDCNYIENLQAVNPGNKISARVYHAYKANISCGNDLFMDILSARIDSPDIYPSCGHTATLAIKNHCTTFSSRKYCSFWPNVQGIYLSQLDYFMEDPIPCPGSWNPSTIQITIDYRCVAVKPPKTKRVVKSDSLSCTMDDDDTKIQVVYARLQAEEKFNKGNICDQDVTKTAKAICDGKAICEIRTNLDFADAKSCEHSREIFVEYKFVKN